MTPKPAWPRRPARLIWLLTLGVFASGCTAADPISGGERRSTMAPTPWHDPSPHRVQFVSVEKNVQLEVLDWGGTGRAVVLLAASGCTAHEFDDFAPKLTDHSHVYGITRRGFGNSGYMPGERGADLLGNDVLAVIDDPVVQTAVSAYSRAFEALTRKQESAIRAAVRSARVVSLPGASHFVFMSNEAEVVREIRAFLAAH